MKRAGIVFFVIFGLVWLAVRSAPPLANHGRKGLQARTIDEMLALPEEEVDVGRGALLIAKEHDPRVEVAKYQTQLDAMALQLRSRIGDERDPETIIAAMNDYIFTEGGYGYGSDDEEEGGTENVGYLHRLLDRKEGTCASLSALYLALAERLNVPVYGVLVPCHLFVRYDHAGMKVNIETTWFGTTFSDSHYIEDFLPCEELPHNSSYMRSLTKKQTLATLMFNLGIHLRIRERLDLAVRALTKSAEVGIKLPEPWMELGETYMDQDNSEDAIQTYRRALEINPDEAEAWVGLGSAYVHEDNHSDAAAAYERALEIAPSLDAVRYELGSAYYAMNRYSDAVDAYRAALRVHDPSLSEEPVAGPETNESDRTPGAAVVPESSPEITSTLSEAWGILAKACFEDELPEVEEVLSALQVVDGEHGGDVGVGPRLARTYYEAGQYAFVRKMDPDFRAYTWDHLQDERDLRAYYSSMGVAASLLLILLALRIQRCQKKTESGKQQDAASPGSQKPLRGSSSSRSVS